MGGHLPERPICLDMISLIAQAKEEAEEGTEDEEPESPEFSAEAFAEAASKVAADLEAEEAPPKDELR